MKFQQERQRGEKGDICWDRCLRVVCRPRGPSKFQELHYQLQTVPILVRVTRTPKERPTRPGRGIRVKIGTDGQQSSDAEGSGSQGLTILYYFLPYPKVELSTPYPSFFACRWLHPCKLCEICHTFSQVAFKVVFNLFHFLGSNTTIILDLKVTCVEDLDAVRTADDG